QRPRGDVACTTSTSSTRTGMSSTACRARWNWKRGQNMARRVPTLMVPQTANVPVNDIPAPEWVTTKGQAGRAETRVFDVRAFGAIGTDDDGPTIKAALDAAAAVGGGVVTTPADEHRIKTGFIQPTATY